MTRVRRPTGGFMSEATLMPDSQLRDQQPTAEGWTSSATPARHVSLPSDASPAGRPFAGAAPTITTCNCIRRVRR